MHGVIYKYTNLCNGKVYVGQTTGTLIKRHREHQCESRRSGKSYFHKAIKKYGSERFEGPVQIDEAETQIELDEKEIHWISELKSYVEVGCGYNLTEGGWGGKPSEETRRKMSIIVKQRYKDNPTSFIPSKETVEKVAMKLRGRKQTLIEKEAHRIAALSADRTYLTPEYRNFIAEQAKGNTSRAMIVYKIVHPDGHEETILNMAMYCRQNGHLRSAMMNVASGKWAQHHGLKVIRLGAN